MTDGAKPATRKSLAKEEALKSFSVVADGWAEAEQNEDKTAVPVVRMPETKPAKAELLTSAQKRQIWEKSRYEALRQQPEVGHDRDSAVDQAGDQRHEFGASLEFDGVGARLLDGAPGIAERLLEADLIAHERHVEDDEGVGSAAPDGAGVMERLLHRERQGVFVSEHGHREGIADEEHIDSCGEGGGGRGGVAGGDHDDFLSGFLVFAEGADVGFAFAHGRTSLQPDSLLYRMLPLGPAPYNMRPEWFFCKFHFALCRIWCIVVSGRNHHREETG